MKNNKKIRAQIFVLFYCFESPDDETSINCKARK